MSSTGTLFTVSAPSGAGKTSLVAALLKRSAKLRVSVSHTTRAMRPGEEDGVNYHFVAESAFVEMLNKSEFLEHARVFGNLYGTSVREIDRARLERKIGVLFDVDYQGARQIKEKYPDAIGVFILPPSMDELRRRLDGRGSDDAESRQLRFDKAREEIGHYPFFDYMIVNDELQRALAELRGIVLAEGCRRRRLAAKAEALLQE